MNPGPKTWNLILAGLDPAKELKRHELLSAHYRAEMDKMGSRRNGTWRELLSSAVFHEESADALRKEGVS